jgi:hypothetical protein
VSTIFPTIGRWLNHKMGPAQIETRFSVLLDERRDCAELMAKCSLCGAITIASLDAA